MGGGGLRILGHKKWHVWRRENIERVNRDEQQHAQQQHQLLLDQRSVEQERRALALQERRQSTSEGRERASGGTASVAEHINFFKREEKEFEQKQQLQLAANKAAVEKSGREPKSSGRVQRQQEQHETLGQQGHLPWYAKPSGGGSDAVSADQSGATKFRGEHKRKRALDDQDPLKHMRPRRSSSSSSSSDERDRKRSRDTEERTERVYKSDYSRVGRSKSTPANDSGNGLRSKVKSTSPEREKKPKKHKKSKRQEKDGALQQLRREREERETRERQRAEALMRGR